jgi:N-acetylglucosaminyldiphosphoundecaprenol N-acetyl-beta-D-mannosaminyltransferase
LNGADYVFGDGTGVRWAARYIHGIRLRDNVNGTDLVPRIFAETAGRGFKYYLLGATPDAITRAAQRAQELFPGWQLAGFRHGYFDLDEEASLVDAINAGVVYCPQSAPDCRSCVPWCWWALHLLVW